MPPTMLRGSDFAPLIKEVRAHGLLERRPRRQGWSAALDLLLYGGVFAAVALAGDTWWQLLLAVPGAVLTTRIYFVGHDAGHGQLAGTRRGNRLLGALIGGALAPTLLAWGLHRSGPTIGALLLNLEAVFTVLLARAVFHEPIGPRVALAVLAMLAGGVGLTLDAWSDSSWGLLGVAAVAAATAAWATDNTLTRPLEDATAS